jgi:periplasmic divalent cation tolerance protein
LLSNQQIINDYAGILIAMTNIVLILTTWPDDQLAKQVAAKWLELKLVACVNILPEMTSIYSWDDEIQIGTEYQMLLKTSAHRVDELMQSIVELHPYECPEILQLPVTGGYDKYLNWIKGNTE